MVASLIGIHLIEPYLALAYFKPVTYEQLIPLSRQLYDDLKNTSSSDLLDVGKFAFSFASELLFEEVILWNSKLLTSLMSYIQLYKPQVLEILDLLLPMVAKIKFYYKLITLAKTSLLKKT